MPKQEKEAVNNLLTKMNYAADSLHRRLDLSAYKSTLSWPGKSYLLVGNSYNTEKRVRGSAKKRSGAIAALMQEAEVNGGKRHCLTVEAALINERFVAVLSRFEYDWLRREPSTTLIGPAYDEQGERLNDSFAVWRQEVKSKKAALVN